MQTYENFAELARICAKQAHFNKDPEVARKLWRMALEYQQRAATLDGGIFPEIGTPPSVVDESSPLSDKL
jgi:hypothetical protein